METDRQGSRLGFATCFVVLAVLVISLKNRSLNECCTACLVPLSYGEMLGATLSINSVLTTLNNSLQGFSLSSASMPSR